MQIRPGSHLPGGTFKAWQLVAFFVPFLLPIVEALRKLGLLSPVHPLWMGLIYSLAGLWLLIFAAGLVKAFPTWALPAVGVILLLIASMFKWMVQGIVFAIANFPDGFAWPDSLSERISLVLIGDLLFVVPMLLFLALILKAAPPLQAKVHEDSTLLSLLVYGMAIPLVVLYDEFQGRGIYELAAILILASGAGLFLFIHSTRLRVGVLATCVLLSACILSFGLYRIFPGQYFATSDPSFRLWESIQPLLEIPALLILLFLPPFFPRLPLFKGDLQPNS